MKKWLVLASFLVLVLLGLFFITQNITGKVSLDFDSKFNTGEKIPGNLVIQIQEGDNIKDNTPILVSLSKIQATGDKIIEAETLSFKEFIDLSNKPIPAEKIGSQYFYTTPGEYSVPINSIIKNSLENPGEYEVYFKIFEPEITIRKRFLVK